MVGFHLTFLKKFNVSYPSPTLSNIFYLKGILFSPMKIFFEYWIIYLLLIQIKWWRKFSNIYSFVCIWLENFSLNNNAQYTLYSTLSSPFPASKYKLSIWNFGSCSSEYQLWFFMLCTCQFVDCTCVFNNMFYFQRKKTF